MSNPSGVRVVENGLDGDFEPGNSEILVATRTSTDPWAVCFGGLRHGFGMPPFEFVNLLRKREVNVMFVRDNHQAWYQRGLRSLSTGLEDTTQVLGDLLADLDASGIVAIGNSAGGYAAAYFGRMLGAQRTIAFAPQTFLDPVRRLRHRESRWSDQTKAMHRTCGLWRSSYRLERLLVQADPNGETHVHYAAGHRLDTRHAEYLRDVPGVVLCPHELDGHDMVKSLRDDGRLGAILDGALSA